METYTFKIKIDDEVVVVACHMQFEQFYDSVKMSGMDKLLERLFKIKIRNQLVFIRIGNSSVNNFFLIP